METSRITLISMSNSLVLETNCVSPQPRKQTLALPGHRTAALLHLSAKDQEGKPQCISSPPWGPQSAKWLK